MTNTPSTSPAPGTPGAVTARHGGPRTPIHGAERDQLRKRVTRLYVQQQLPMREVAAMVGRSYGLINKLLTEGKVKRRPSGIRRRKPPAGRGPSGMPSPGAPRDTGAGQRAVPARTAAEPGSGELDRVMPL